MPRSGIEGSCGSSTFSLFKETPYCFPQWLHQFTFPPTVQKGSFFSTPSPSFIICRLFDDGHSDRCEVIPHCSFDLHVSIISDDEHLFMCLLAICMSGQLILFMVSFVVQKLLSLIMSCLFIFVFITLRDVSKTSCCYLCQRVFCLCFPLRVL